MGCCNKNQHLNSSSTLQKASTHLIEGHFKSIGVLSNLCTKEELLGFRTGLSNLKKVRLKSPELFSVQ